jgi:hypothetical protein
VRRNLYLRGLRWLGILDFSDVEVLSILLSEEFGGERINSLYIELASEGLYEAIRLKLITSPVEVANMLMAWLGDTEVLWELLALHQHREVVAAIIRVVDLSDLNGIIRKEVVNNVWKIVKTGIEAKNSAIIVEELLLRLYSTSS